MATPEQTMQADQEGRAAWCRECGQVVNLTKRGRFFAHAGALEHIGQNRFVVVVCNGSGEKPSPPGLQ